MSSNRLVANTIELTLLTTIGCYPASLPIVPVRVLEKGAVAHVKQIKTKTPWADNHLLCRKRIIHFI